MAPKRTPHPPAKAVAEFKMGSFGKTALIGQISGISPQKKWVRLVILAFGSFASEKILITAASPIETVAIVTVPKAILPFLPDILLLLLSYIAKPLFRQNIQSVLKNQSFQPRLPSKPLKIIADTDVCPGIFFLRSRNQTKKGFSFLWARLVKTTAGFAGQSRYLIFSKSPGLQDSSKNG
jgi:hypothetical protein